MAGLDMSDVLNDADFQDAITVSRTLVSYSSGMAVSGSTQTFDLSCPVIPDPANVTRQADGSYLSASISIYTQERLMVETKINDASFYKADVISWHGGRYMVKAVNDYSAFGKGFWQVSADLVQTSATA